MDELDDILSHKLNTDIYSIIYNRNNADIIEIRYYDCSSKPESRGELINHSIPDDCVVPSIIKFMKKYSPDTTVYLTVDKGETNLISLGFNKRYFNPVLVSTNLFYRTTLKKFFTYTIYEPLKGLNNYIKAILINMKYNGYSREDTAKLLCVDNSVVDNIIAGQYEGTKICPKDNVCRILGIDDSELQNDYYENLLTKINYEDIANE